MCIIPSRAAEYMAILEQGNTAYKNDKLVCIEVNTGACLCIANILYV